MALSTSQISPLVLRNRTIPRHTQQYVPHLNDINNHVDKYLNKIRTQVASLTTKQQIVYWSSKISEHVHICIDILLPDFDNFTHIIMLRWLTIGYSLYELAQIWKRHKAHITSHTRIDEWLPYIVKQKLAPNLIPRGRYGQLRKYIIIWENRELITKLPTLRQEHTHRLNEMLQWIREFNEKVKLMAMQRDIEVPCNMNEQIELYKVYLRNHSEPVESDGEDVEDECKTLDTLLSEYLPGVDDVESEDEDVEDKDEDDDSDEDGDQATLSATDLQLMKYRETIKKLKAELSETKKTLKDTQYSHCKASRERHVYRELHKYHQIEIKNLNDTINNKNMELIGLNETVMSLKRALMDTKKLLGRIQIEFMESRKLMDTLMVNNSEERSGGLLSGNNRESLSTNRLCRDVEEIDDMSDINSVNSDAMSCASSVSFVSQDNDRNIVSVGDVSYKKFHQNYNRKRNTTKIKYKQKKHKKCKV